jgi:hypothetical protein
MGFSSEELKLLKQAREIEATLNTEGWKIIKSIYEAQMHDRHVIIMSPGHDMDASLGGILDGATRYAAFEHVKGAYNGLALALSLPQSILDEAKRLRESSPNEGEGK